MKIAFLGDIALIGKYDLSNNNRSKFCLKELAEKLKDFDYVVANLESPLTDKTTSLIPKSMHLRSAIENIELLKFLNINAVTLANNHINDFGRKGIEDTIRILEENGIEWFGLNRKNIEKRIMNEKISISGYSCLSTNGTGYSSKVNKKGINVLSYDSILEQMTIDKENEALSIISIHWGMEHTNFPNVEHVRMIEKLSRINKSIIHGHHPHVIQSVIKYEESLVAYSLGNCVFDEFTSINKKYKMNQTDDNKKSFVLEVEIKNAKIVSFYMHGFKITNDGFEFFNINDEIEKINDKLLSFDFDNPKDTLNYNLFRENEYSTQLQKKFGKRDLEWFLSRLSYHNIGAKLLGIARRKRYIKEVKKTQSKINLDEEELEKGRAD